MKIIKRSGDIVDFDKNKLRLSLMKSGADPILADRILQAIQKQIFDGISTKIIYKLAFGLLKKESHAHAARYNLRTAIELLGPAGFFFEKYISRLFINEGYQSKTNLLLQGKCVQHEIDVVIMKNNIISMIECKFHPRRESNSDVKVPMYILSRFNDLKDRKHMLFSKKDLITACWIITNNRFTSEAINFANCSGLKPLAWDYPADNNLRTKIDHRKLYPITCMTSLSISEKEKLLIMDVILVKELFNHSEILEKIGFSRNRIKNVQKEASELCGIF